ncbi:hypothetical protein GCM10007977_027600 [Dactylosporangium sucinum]|uniref:Uncharacterized protein n=1 Tax=Dactylosporangium sucinum TaxID=1424081 RepID=A0A917TIQ0_9ACTN|nr:hypothetical protein GCM10007977_027600 [Dactylosporangium sucinum]
MRLGAGLGEVGDADPGAADAFADELQRVERRHDLRAPAASAGPAGLVVSASTGPGHHRKGGQASHNPTTQHADECVP